MSTVYSNKSWWKEGTISLSNIHTHDIVLQFLFFGSERNSEIPVLNLKSTINPYMDLRASNTTYGMVYTVHDSLMIHMVWWYHLSWTLYLEMFHSLNEKLLIEIQVNTSGLMVGEGLTFGS